MLKLLPLAPSIESFKKSCDHYIIACNSETVGATNWSHSFLESQEKGESVGIRNKAVGNILWPQLTFKVWWFSCTCFWAKSRFLMNVTKTFINQKRFRLQFNAAPFWNLENQSNPLVFWTKLLVIQFCHNNRLKFADFRAFRENSNS